MLGFERLILFKGAVDGDDLLGFRFIEIWDLDRGEFHSNWSIAVPLSSLRTVFPSLIGLEVFFTLRILILIGLFDLRIRGQMKTRFSLGRNTFDLIIFEVIRQSQTVCWYS